MSSDLHDRLERLRQAGRLRRPTPAMPAASPFREPLREPPQELPQEPGALLLGRSASLPGPVPHDVEALTDLPGVEERRSRGGRYLLRTVRYPLSHRVGQVQIGDLLDLPVGAADLAGRNPGQAAALAAFDFRRVLFLDTETSGLAGGTGVIVFLTGIGKFEIDVEAGALVYVVRQYFARTPDEEAAYLHDLADVIESTPGFVSFNGKAFDLPLLRTRFLMAGLEPPDDRYPHLDLLHPARRLWRERLGACNFGNLEMQILGHRRSGQDVPSWMIPEMWFRFAAGEGNVADMAAVLYHNQEDVVNMVPLARVLCGVYSGDWTPHPVDRLALARHHAQSEHQGEAEAAYRQALAGDLTTAQRLEAWLGLAAALKRQERCVEAADCWVAAVDLAPINVIEPHLALAKHYEWEARDAAAALYWTEQALARVEQWRPDYHRRQVLADLEHRQRRLLGKAQAKNGNTNSS